MLICGIDSGLSGALALYDTDTHGVVVYDMPVFVVLRGKTKRHDLNGHALFRILSDPRPGHAFIELPQVIPTRSSKAGSRGTSAYGALRSGICYGEIRGILIGCGIPITEVQPQAWKKALAVPADKEGARKRASDLLPNSAHIWPLHKHADRAEASLIALYGFKSLNAIATGKAA